MVSGLCHDCLTDWNLLFSFSYTKMLETVTIDGDVPAEESEWAEEHRLMRRVAVVQPRFWYMSTVNYDGFKPEFSSM